MDFVEGLKRIANEDITPRLEARAIRDVLIQQLFPQMEICHKFFFANCLERQHMHRLLDQANPGKYEGVDAAIYVDRMVRQTREREKERGNPLTLPFSKVAEPIGMRDIKVPDKRFLPPDQSEYKGWDPI
jgi:hypothetical protein